MRTKAEFKALRETAGVTQSSLARELGVEVRSVKRWESQDAPQTAPEDAWKVIDAAIVEQIRFVDGMAAEFSDGVLAVTLPYWANQEEFDGAPLDGFDDFRAANAAMRSAYAVLVGFEMEIRWESGSEFDGSFHPEFAG